MKFFKPEDFKRMDLGCCWGHFSPSRARVFADFCNAKLERLGTIVYGVEPHDDYSTFATDRHDSDTHEFLLICIEPIEKPMYGPIEIKIPDNMKKLSKEAFIEETKRQVEAATKIIWADLLKEPCTHPAEKVKCEDHGVDYGYFCECGAKVFPSSFSEVKE